MKAGKLAALLLRHPEVKVFMEADAEKGTGYMPQINSVKQKFICECCGLETGCRSDKNPIMVKYLPVFVISEDVEDGDHSSAK